MGLNWVEEIVSHLYRIKGYMVIENEDLPMPKRPDRGVQGHSDIDVMAINNKEVLHIECQSWWGPERKEEEKQFNRLRERFVEARTQIFKKYNFLDPDKLGVKRIFVTSGKPKKSRGNGPWDRLQNFCSDNNIELVEINQIIKQLIEQLNDKYPTPTRVGKEEGIARFLLHLIHKEFLKEEFVPKKVRKSVIAI